MHSLLWNSACRLTLPCITCRHYQREIAAHDIQTKRVDVYGQDAGYSERCMVIYDGEPGAVGLWLLFVSGHHHVSKAAW